MSASGIAIEIHARTYDNFGLWLRNRQQMMRGEKTFIGMLTRILSITYKLLQGNSFGKLSEKAFTEIDVIQCYFREVHLHKKREINQICAPQIAFQIPQNSMKLHEKFFPPPNENQITKLFPRAHEKRVRKNKRAEKNGKAVKVLLRNYKLIRK